MKLLWVTFFLSLSPACLMWKGKNTTSNSHLIGFQYRWNTVHASRLQQWPGRRCAMFFSLKSRVSIREERSTGQSGKFTLANELKTVKVYIVQSYPWSNQCYFKFQIFLRSWSEQWTAAGSSEDCVGVVTPCSVPGVWTSWDRKDCYLGRSYQTGQ